jgi:signal transduction histidine kinase/ActR/RegA family two-component response regulator
LKYASEGAGTAPLTIATRNDAPLLASIIAKGLAAVTPAEREELRRRWIRLDDPGARIGRSLIAALAVTVGLALLVTLVVLAWNGTLRRRVAETTAGLQAELAERRRAEEALVRVQRLESLSVLAGGIAHDFNNLLTGILANISMAREEPSPPPGELSELLVDAESAARRAQALTRQLLTFSKGGAPVTRLVNLLPLVQESALFAARGTAATCTVRAAADLWPAAVDPGQIGQVVQNLVINAVEAMTSGGAVEVTLENRTLATATPGGLQPGPFVLLRVRDQGKGVAAELLPRIFDPFFSTKQRGSGLGLAVTHSVVVRHGGAIEASSQVGRGTTFEILLPGSPGRVSAQQADPTRAQQRCGRVLVMDDEEMLRRVAARIIGSLGCEVVAAAEGAEAIARWEQARAEGRPFDAVVVDLTVRGGLGGVETLRRLREQDPGVRVVVSSGYSEASEMASHAAHGFAAVLPKPYSAEDARAAIGPLLPLA